MPMGQCAGRKMLSQLYSVFTTTEGSKSGAKMLLKMLLSRVLFVRGGVLGIETGGVMEGTVVLRMMSVGSIVPGTTLIPVSTIVVGIGTGAPAWFEFVPSSMSRRGKSSGIGATLVRSGEASTTESGGSELGVGKESETAVFIKLRR